MRELARWIPVGTSLVQRVKENIATFSVEMPDDKLSGRVVNDYCIAALPKLIQELGDKYGLSRPGVSHDQKVKAFVLAPYADDFGAGDPAGCDANSIAASHLVELHDFEHLRSAD